MIVSENEIKFPSMMEESENKSHTDNIVNVNYTSLYHTKKGKGTFPDISSQDAMV